MNLFKFRIGMIGLLSLLGVQIKAQQRLHDVALEQRIRAAASPALKNVLDHPEIYQYQLIYTEITRNSSNQPVFRHQYLNVSDSMYFNPASMVKFPVALMVMEKMDSLRSLGINPLTLLKTDSSAPKSLLELVREAMIVSDNVAYNKLFQFLGQEAINVRLQEMGYTGSRITRRFIPLTPEQHRVTEAVQLLTSDGRLLMEQPAIKSAFPFDFSRRILVGNAHYNWSDSLVQEPFDFTTHNRIPLRDMQQVLQSFLFPSSVPERQRFHLSDETRKLMLDAISELPSESRFPVFDTTEFFDSYSKFFLYRDGKRKVPDHIRIFNKTGWSYGYLIDVAYILDKSRNREFMLSGVIYVNSDGILNDNRYEYDSIGYPFFREIGEILLQSTVVDATRHRRTSSRPVSAITRGDSTRKALALVFTGHEFGEGGATIRRVLKKKGVKASFFLTGDFYRNLKLQKLIRELKADGHYMGGHGDKHLLCCDWSNRDSLLVSKEIYQNDIRNNEEAMRAVGIDASQSVYFMPSYEWYNDSIVWWTKQLGRHLVNNTSGTLSQADYTRIQDKNYRNTETIFASIKDRETKYGLNGFLLLLHVGTGPGRPDPFWNRLEELITWLQQRGYQLETVPSLLE
ncbi:serine hydrolase [Flavihumibacter sp. RY-1]|uniref:Serine hydrolase n=1 Tax=Flavihumibacter fluminis TaxID=2909236 RepID=A0ABS9BK66_9BACT|nr:serine hydrolase [Flavihumibacter fluminis]MCF1715735.1 serine hydrolase [Flavihumibacter fluminis]